MEQLKLPLSVAIITFNEEANIARTLESIVDITSEVIIVDSNSTDKTTEIAKKFGANIFTEEWKGHIKQKNSALIKCNQPWILSLDADEVVSQELKQKIIEIIKDSESDSINPTLKNGVHRDKPAGYFINRKTHYLGKIMNYSWQPDWNLRLVQKTSSPVWQGLDPHDELIINGKTARLNGDLVHYSYKDLKHHFIKTVEYAKISAKSYYQNGKKFRYRYLLLNPWIAFIKLYILHRGFLDGSRGIIAGFSTFMGTFLKYAFLLELKKSKN
jgi:glycosyltransferase involved in cell wall biosynthesis